MAVKKAQKAAEKGFPFSAADFYPASGSNVLRDMDVQLGEVQLRGGSGVQDQ